MFYCDECKILHESTQPRVACYMCCARTRLVGDNSPDHNAQRLLFPGPTVTFEPATAPGSRGWASNISHANPGHEGTTIGTERLERPSASEGHGTSMEGVDMEPEEDNLAAFFHA